MPRIARVVATGIPHHITQRGNRRQETFFFNFELPFLEQHTAFGLSPLVLSPKLGSASLGLDNP